MTDSTTTQSTTNRSTTPASTQFLRTSNRLAMGRPGTTTCRHPAKQSAFAADRRARVSARAPACDSWSRPAH